VRESTSQLPDVIASADRSQSAMPYTTLDLDGSLEARKRRRRWPWLLLGVPVLMFSFLRWGGYMLLASDPLPAHVDAAIILEGSIAGEKARVSGAVQLLQQGIADRVLVSVPKESYWGQAIPPVARDYIESNYGSAIASRFDFCENNALSTEEEARALAECIRTREWKTVATITSSYHTRRARFIWKRTIRRQAPAVSFFIDGVSDPAFQPQGWWRHRLYAKTWFLEFTKLAWTLLFESPADDPDVHLSRYLHRFPRDVIVRLSFQTNAMP
jgi:hypothetical protein